MRISSCRSSRRSTCFSSRKNRRAGRTLVVSTRKITTSSRKTTSPIFHRPLLGCGKNVQPPNCSSRRSPIRSIISSATGVPSLNVSGTYSSYSFTRGRSGGADDLAVPRNFHELDAGVAQPASGGGGDQKRVVRQGGAGRVPDQETPGAGPIL